MKITYSKYLLLLKLDRSVTFPMLPSFLFRSMLGKELRNLTCLFRKRSCGDCDLKFQCPYSFIFESPIQKNTAFLSGRNTATHPFVLSTDTSIKETTADIKLYLTLLGKSDDYFPYIFYAFKKAGENGVLRDRVKYTIKDIKQADKSILKSDGSIQIEQNKEEFQVDTSLRGKRSQTIVIQAKTPIRLKHHGTYLSHLSYNSILNSINRKLLILSSMYGSTELQNKLQEQMKKLTYNHKETANFQWLDLHRYSARQKQKIKMGGVVGSLISEGKISPLERSLLSAAELFHVGKNVSFGLGKIEVTGI